MPTNNINLGDTYYAGMPLPAGSLILDQETGMAHRLAAYVTNFDDRELNNDPDWRANAVDGAAGSGFEAKGVIVYIGNGALPEQR